MRALTSPEGAIVMTQLRHVSHVEKIVFLVLCLLVGLLLRTLRHW